MLPKFPAFPGIAGPVVTIVMDGCPVIQKEPRMILGSFFQEALKLTNMANMLTINSMEVDK